MTRAGTNGQGEAQGCAEATGLCCDLQCPLPCPQGWQSLWWLLPLPVKARMLSKTHPHSSSVAVASPASELPSRAGSAFPGVFSIFFSPRPNSLLEKAGATAPESSALSCLNSPGAQRCRVTQTAALGPSSPTRAPRVPRLPKAAAPLPAQHRQHGEAVLLQRHQLGGPHAVWLGLPFLGGGVGTSRVPHHQLPGRGARQSLGVVEMKNRLAEASHHAVEGLQRERRGRALDWGAGSSLLKQRRSCLLPCVTSPPCASTDRQREEPRGKMQ